MSEKPSSALILTGASGLIGRALSPLEPNTPLPRRAPPNGGPWWEPDQGRVHNLPDRIHAVVHLAGENIASGRWSSARKARIRSSRIQGTQTLVQSFAQRTQRPEVLVMASGISFYGDQGDTDLTESSPAGSGFLSELTQEWEAAGSRAEDLGIRVVLLRLGVVLSGAGGALEKMRRPFRMGLGGPLGSGAQWFPWIHIDDVVGVIQWALQTPSARGAYNLVAPEQVQQRDFARSLGRAMGRPAVLPAPEFALRLTFGELADEAMLASHRARPFRLKSADFPFQWPELAPALEDVVRGGSTAPA